MKNYYEILEINFSSTPEEIKKAYRQKAIKYHPDKNFGNIYFANKFIEAKEAFDILSDLSQKAEYDILYKTSFAQDEPKREENKKEEKQKSKKEEFFYNPHKPFYSDLDRTEQETPQFSPLYNHWAEKVSETDDFFKLPNSIGKIISGYTNLTTTKKPVTRKEKNGCFLKAIVIALVISLIIIFIFKLLSPTEIIFSIAIPLVVILWLANSGNKFKHKCNYVGVNGFAEFQCENDRENITLSYEVNFKNVTDFLRATQINKRNFNYVNTGFSFIWMNGQSLLREVNGTHESKEGNPGREKTEYWLNTFAEKYWTIYLMDTMELNLEKEGFLKFNLVYYKNDRYHCKQYIELGIGYIKFLTEKGDVVYNFNEIKKVYTKGANLFIEHSNYEKKFYFFESGNKNGIPLLNLSNRQFFFRAMELLLGYKFS